VATVAIVDYDPSWPDQFEQLAAALRRRLGDAATPTGRTTGRGGDAGDPGLWEKRPWQAPPGARRRVNVHVRVAGWPNQRHALLFRDHLRAHPRAAAAYARLKRGLAERLGDDLGAYTELKDPACDPIVVAAEDWAAGRVGRDPDASGGP
jgi:GrpB-like predicted nucleotidyltransferase (UPF0157 family)